MLPILRSGETESIDVVTMVSCAFSRSISQNDDPKQSETINERMENADTVHSAVLTLHSDNHEAAAKANVWLGEFQKSLHAWSVCDKLLRERRDDVSAYFCAQTMRIKIQCSFHELPADSYPSLKESILTHLTNFGATSIGTANSVIITQLCLALADLYLQVPAWTHFVHEIFIRFGKEPSLESNNGILLTLLKVFPEENESKHLRLGLNRRKEVSNELAQQTPQVIQYLNNLSSSGITNEETVRQVLSCLGSWLINKSVPTSNLASSQLLQAIFSLLGSENSPSKLHEAATECVIQALYLAEDLMNHGSLAESLFAGVHSLQPAFHLAVAHEDLDRLENLARLFTELAESLLPVMIDTRGQSLGTLTTLDLILVAVGYHDYSICEMTFNVWYRTSEFLYNRNDEELNEMFRPYMERLIMSLYKHGTFQSDHLGTPDDNEEFADFRLKLSEVMKDIVFLVGSITCFQQMLEILKSQGGSGSWEDTESALFIMSAVAKNIVPEEESVVPVVMEAVLALPPEATHVCIRYTAIQLVRELQDWIVCNHQTFIGRTLEWLLHQMASSTKLVSVAVDAIECLTRHGAPHLQEYLDQLLSALQALDNHSPRLPENAILSMLRSVALVITTLPFDQINARLENICHMQAVNLAECISQEKTERSKKNNNNEESGGSARTKAVFHAEPIKWLDRLSAILRQLQTPNGTEKPWNATIIQLWTLLSESLAVWEGNQRAVEHVCRTIRFAIRALGTHSFPFMENLVSQMVEVYSRHHHSCFLYLASILVDEYGTFKEVGPGLLQMLEALAGPSLKLLEEDEKGYRNHPDTVDDLSRLCIRFVQRVPFPFFLSPAAPSLYASSIRALSLDHFDAHGSVTKFITETAEFICAMRERGTENDGVDAAERILLESGGAIVKECITAAIFTLPKQLILHIADIIYVFRKLSQQHLSEWLKASLESIPNVCSLSATSQQLEQFHSSILRSTDRGSILNGLHELIRLYK